MREMESRGEGENGMNSLLSHSHSQMSLEAEDHHHHHHHQNGHNNFHETQNDFFEQILSSGIPNCSWPPASDSNPNPKSGDDDPDGFRHQINGASAAVKSMLLQQQLHSSLLPLPLSLGTPPDSVDSLNPSPFKSQGGGDASVQALFNGFAGSLANQQQHFHPGSAQNYAGQAAGVMNQAPPTSASTGGGGSNGTASQKQNKPRARRGQATDPHSIAERLRRERIAERMKALQELVPNANKTDKASMLDEIIDYVKFLQLQVKVLSMSRLGGAGAIGSLVADRASEGGRGNANQTAGASSTNDSSMTVTEHQVAKLMEEDMGSAMQYLQGKGLCLMPISLATAISTATCHSRNPLPPALTRAALLNNLTNNGNHNLDNSNNNNKGNDPTSSNTNVPQPPSSPTHSRD